MPAGSNSVSDIGNYFEYIIKNHETLTDNPPIRICVNKTEKNVTFEIKNIYIILNFQLQNWWNYFEALNVR